MFHLYIDQTIKLITEQITQVRQSRSRVKVNINSLNIYNHILIRFVVHIPV